MQNINDLNFIQQLAKIPNCKITPRENLGSKYTQDWRGKYEQMPLIMVQPQNTEAVQYIVKLCHQYHYKIAIQGGNTSLCGGSIASKDQQVLINLELMNQIREYDELSKTVIVEAGCTLQQVQQFAKQQQAFYPLSLPSEQWCTIGGNLATNAGGVAVLRYGNSRQLCLGLEVVLANGELYQGLYQLTKNNMGYDLKHLFIGAEGTLGIITAASLQFFEEPSQQKVYLFACDDMSQIMHLFKYLKNKLAPLLTGFELINQSALNCVEVYLNHKNEEIFKSQHPYKNQNQNHHLHYLLEIFKSIQQTNTLLKKKQYYALCEISEYPWVKSIDVDASSGDLASDIWQQNELKNIFIFKIKKSPPIKNNQSGQNKPSQVCSILEIQYQKQDTLISGVSAELRACTDHFILPDQLLNVESDIAPMHAFWQIRHAIPTAQKFLGGNLKHDVSVKLGDIAKFIEQACYLILAKYEKAEFIIFGHLGDGNIHFNVDINSYKNLINSEFSENSEKLKYQSISNDISWIIYNLIQKLGGSIAAEHGIGQLKKELLKKHIPQIHLELMQRLKNTFDESGQLSPQNIF